MYAVTLQSYVENDPKIQKKVKKKKNVSIKTNASGGISSERS